MGETPMPRFKLFQLQTDPLPSVKLRAQSQGLTEKERRLGRKVWPRSWHLPFVTAGPIARGDLCTYEPEIHTQLPTMLDPVVQHNRSQKHHLRHRHDRLSIEHR